MAFDNEDVTEEINNLFAEHQDTYHDAIMEEFIMGPTLVGGHAGHISKDDRAIRVFTPNPTKSPERLANMRSYFEGYKHEEIKAAILRGERPLTGNGRRGPTPKRWLRAAAELGVDLFAGQAPYVPKARASRRGAQTAQRARP